MAAGPAQRGLSLIELMIGVTIALFVAAAGSTLLAGSFHPYAREPSDCDNSSGCIAGRNRSEN